MRPLVNIIGGLKKKGAVATILDRCIGRLRALHNHHQHLPCPTSKRISP